MLVHYRARMRVPERSWGLAVRVTEAFSGGGGNASGISSKPPALCKRNGQGWQMWGGTAIAEWVEKGVRWFMWSKVYKTVVRLATFLETMLLKRQEEALLKFSWGVTRLDSQGWVVLRPELEKANLDGAARKESKRETEKRIDGRREGRHEWTTWCPMRDIKRQGETESDD